MEEEEERRSRCFVLFNSNEILFEEKQLAAEPLN